MKCINVKTIIAIISLTFFPLMLSISTVKQKEQGVQDALNFILDGLDKTKNPCNSFYYYSCGQWVANNRHKSNEYEEEFAKSQQKFRTLLFDDLKSINLSSTSTKFYAESVRIFFDKCLEAKIDKQRENVDLYNAVKNIIGPMPFLEPLAVDSQQVDTDVWTLNALFQTALHAEFLFGIGVESQVRA